MNTVKKTLLYLAVLLLLSSQVFAGSVDKSADGWQHPTKEIFEQYGLRVDNVELYSDGNYPVFFLQPSMYTETIYDYRFLSKIAERNGFWDYKIVCGDSFVEVYCNKAKKRVVRTKSNIGDREYDDYDETTARQKAIELVMADRKLTYNKETDDYSWEGKSFTVKLKDFGFDMNGRYEIRISPTYYSLAVFSYCYVDLKNETILVKGYEGK